jgi:uncharacterized protein YciI
MRMDSRWCDEKSQKLKVKIVKQYLIIANDGKDDGALDRRKEVRPLHLAGAKKLKENSNFVIGGAMLDDDGNMRGSIMIVQFETQEDFQKWYDNEPYIKQGVWKTIEVKPFRVADV